MSPRAPALQADSLPLSHQDLLGESKLFLEKPIEELDISTKLAEKLKSNNLIYVKDIWMLKRKDLKNIQLSDSEINQIIIKLQLHGCDLNKKIY